MLGLDDASVAGTDSLAITFIYVVTAILTITAVIFLCACVGKKERVGKPKGLEDEIHTAIAMESPPANQSRNESVTVEEMTEVPNCQMSLVLPECEYDAIGNDDVKASNDAKLTSESTGNTIGHNASSGPLLPPRNSGSHVVALNASSAAEYTGVAVRQSVIDFTSSSTANDDTYEDVDEVTSKARENQSKWNSGIVPLDDVYEPVGNPESPNAGNVTAVLNSAPPSTIYDSIVIEVDRIPSATLSLLTADQTGSVIDDHYEPFPGDKSVGPSGVWPAARPDGAFPATTGTVAENATASSPSMLSRVHGLAAGPPQDTSYLYAKVNKKKKSPTSDEKTFSFVTATSRDSPVVAVSPTSSDGRDGYSTIADVMKATQDTSTEAHSAVGSPNKMRLIQNDSGYDSVEFDLNLASPLQVKSSGYDGVGDGTEHFSQQDDIYEEVGDALEINGANEVRVF